MNRKEMIAHVSEQTGHSKSNVEEIITALLESWEGALVNGDSVQLVNFFTLSLGIRKARTGIDPRTRNSIQIPEKKVVKFKVGKQLKDKVNES